MTQPSKAAMAKADSLANDVQVGGGYRKALAQVLQEHSDVAKAALDRTVATGRQREGLQSLILPDEPDPTLTALMQVFCDVQHWVGDEDETLRRELAKRGGRIVFDD